jgi:DNA-nicking Smr family endonuclease
MNSGHEPPDEFAAAPVPVPPDGVLDLHGFRPQDVADVVAEYLADCHSRGIRELRIIHGRGIGELRRTVRHVLERSPLVESFADAAPHYGGHGATIVRCRAES